jgi:hypothetical protein
MRYKHGDQVSPLHLNTMKDESHLSKNSWLLLAAAAHYAQCIFWQRAVVDRPVTFWDRVGKLQHQDIGKGRVILGWLLNVCVRQEQMRGHCWGNALL